MRKQTKWAVILGAAAVMTFGACMTSFAATGWVEEGGEWYYYNKDEEAVTEKWQKGNDGTFYYLGDEGTMVKSDWVETDEYTYYVNSYGARCMNEWRYMYGKDGESADEESWFYFDANGKMAKKKTTVNGKTYYFDADGKLVTGWLTIDGDNVAAEHEDSAVTKDSYYTNKDGERVTGWMKLYAPDDEDEDDQYWYNFKSDGKVRLDQKATINNKNYVFNEKGEMLSGWVYAWLGTTADEKQIVDIDEDTDLTGQLGNVGQYYYAGGKDDGSIKKNVWINVVPAGKDEEDSDIDKEWYYTSKDGRLNYAGGPTTVVGVAVVRPGSGNITGVELADKAKTSEIGTKGAFTDWDASKNVGLKKVGTKTYLFNSDGMMVSGLINVLGDDISSMSEGVYYFGKSNDGVMKATTINLVDDDDVSHAYAFSASVKDGFSKGQAVTGVVSSKLYNEGLVVKAAEGSKFGVAKIMEELDVSGTVTLEPTFYIVNESGRVTTGIKSTVKTDSETRYRNLAKVNVGAPADISGGVPTIINPKAVPGYIVQKYEGTPTSTSSWALVTADESLEK